MTEIAPLTAATTIQPLAAAATMGLLWPRRGRPPAVMPPSMTSSGPVM